MIAQRDGKGPGKMRVSQKSSHLMLCALAAGLSAPALADDPFDPVMASRAERARDRAIIRQLNEDQLAYVRERDAGYARGWQDYRDARGSAPDGDAYDTAPPRYADEGPREPDHRDSGQNAYARALSDYDAAMADWRRDVSDCRSGYYDRCAR